MATKKAGSTAKKSTRAKSQPAKTTTKSTVTTVRAVEAAKPAKATGSRFGDRRTVLVAALIGEFIGTFLLTAAFLVTKGEPLYLGFVLITLILMVGTLSGGYLNPMLTVGAWVTRKLSHLRAISYIVAQFVGAVAAFVVLSAFVSGAATDASSSAYAQTQELFQLQPLTDKNQLFAFFAELLGATVFAFAFAGALRERTDRVAKALTVGFGLFVAALIAGVSLSYVGAQVALNPAVALSAGAVDWASINWFAVLAYVAAPLIGGIIGFALRDVVETKDA